MASDETPDPPPKPRSLFSRRPAWATASPADQADTPPSEVFTRKTQTHDELYQETVKKHTRSEKSRGKAQAEGTMCNGDNADGGLHKRRRISEETYARYGMESPEKKASRNQVETVTVADDGDEIIAQAQALKRKSQDANVDHDDNAPRPATRKTAGSRSKATSFPTPDQIISLSDSETEAGATRRRATEPPTPASIHSDEEFPELVALARERRRRGDNKGVDNLAPTASAEPEFDPVIKILVTSPISNTKPLLVHRRLSQRLAEIRTVWCQRQGFNDEQTRQVFLTYRMRKLYDATTCKSLGIKFDQDGNLMSGGQEGDIFGRGANEGTDQGRVHVEAVTEEAFAAQKKQKEEERAKARKLVSLAEEEVASGHATPIGGEDGQEEDQKIRITLKGRGYKDYKLIVRPTTTFERIISRFKKENKIADDVPLTLHFDGDKMNPDDTIQDTDIQDMDGLEMHAG